MVVIHKARDNGLLAEILRDFVGIDLLKDIDPADVITVLLAKINVPSEEINEIVNKIEEVGVKEMFAIVNYDVQETRQAAHSEGIAEGKAEGIAEGKAEGIAEGRIEAAVSLVEKMGLTVRAAMGVLDLPCGEEGRLIEELEKRGTPYVLE